VENGEGSAVPFFHFGLGDWRVFEPQLNVWVPKNSSEPKSVVLTTGSASGSRVARGAALDFLAVR
jgi:hypothetical protein